MPTKSQQRTDDFTTYLEAHQQAFECAQKAMLLRSAAKLAEAQAAANYARHWLTIIRELERQEARRVKNSIDGRRL
jgi:hypothetical protein